MYSNQRDPWIFSGIIDVNTGYQQMDQQLHILYQQSLSYYLQYLWSGAPPCLFSVTFKRDTMSSLSLYDYLFIYLYSPFCCLLSAHFYYPPSNKVNSQVMAPRNPLQPRTLSIHGNITRSQLIPIIAHIYLFHCCPWPSRIYFQCDTTSTPGWLSLLHTMYNDSLAVTWAPSPWYYEMAGNYH